MKMVNKLTFGVAAFLCGGSIAMADTVPATDAWYVAPVINWVKPDTGFGVDKNDFGLGLRFGKAIAPNLDVQFGTSYVRVKDNSVKYQQWLLGADGLYMFSRDRFRPFVLAGLGAEYDKKDLAGGNASKTVPYINAGLGFQYAFNDKLGVQVDYRRVHGFSGSNSFGFKNPNSDYLGVGLNMAFGSH